MATDLAALRVELKTFERKFKADHGKGPSPEDIKAAGLGSCFIPTALPDSTSYHS